ncbi:MAG: hypothetical protein QOD39_4096 [Mycobacterium sp.]|nr:hypothetical protein [Mycobacterium sp.]
MLEVIDKGSSTESHRVPLLFVHGACGTALCWDEHFLDFFADKGYRAVALSLRGHGASSLSKPLNSCSIADYVDDVHAVADELGSPPVLIGHSMGCTIVLNYPVRHHSPAAILLAPCTPRGIRQVRIALSAVTRGLHCVSTPSAPKLIFSILRPWLANSYSPRAPPTPSSHPVPAVSNPRAHALHEKRPPVFPMPAS